MLTVLRRSLQYSLPPGLRGVSTATSRRFEESYGIRTAGGEGADIVSVLVPEFKADGPLPEALSLLSGDAHSTVVEMVSEEKFTGKKGTSLVARVAAVGAGAPRYVSIHGVGPVTDPASEVAERIRCGSASAMGAATRARCVEPVVHADPAIAAALPSWPQYAAEGTALFSYEMSDFKEPPAEESKPAIRSVTIRSDDRFVAGGLYHAQGLADGAFSSADADVQRARDIAAATNSARRLVDLPPNVCNPEFLASHAAAMTGDRMEVTIHDAQACEEMGMGLMLAVGRGSKSEARLIHIKYSPPAEPANRIALVGKGVTFDSGGYNLKVGASQIELMKFDMGGAAAVLGAAEYVRRAGLERTEVHFVVPAVENMVAGDAYRPGDVIRAYNGKHVEIHNTDAEGRLALADALCYVEDKVRPDQVIDLATLTGACVVGLGEGIAGLFTPDDSIAAGIAAAASEAGEKLWRMPMEASYMDDLKSNIADMRNSGSRSGGAITAALFLKEFVTDGLPMAHVDIAGPCWKSKDGGYMVKGATGFGVRTLAYYLSRMDTEGLE